MADYDFSRRDVPLAEPAIGHAPASEIVQAELAEQPPPVRYRRRATVPIILFLLTCASTFFAGATGWLPAEHLFGGELDAFSPYFQLTTRLAVLQHWQQGMIYMACVLAILLTHEMGHFVMTLIYRVRSTWPLFIPFPISPIGTMGAVIAMEGYRADRRQIFDIGLAGPLAGLVVAIPIMWVGAAQLDLTRPPGDHSFGLPLVVQYLMHQMHPGNPQAHDAIGINQLNPYFMAGWVGLLVTGLNMLPVSQLDGGHVTYALFGRKAHWIARLFMLAVFIYMGLSSYLTRSFPPWMLMAVLVMLMGTDHPPTRDDTVPLGWFRIALGALSLLIPVFCFAPNLIQFP
jgi:membrane-associated protease RseP (regulator of RpoE activity)